MSWNAHIKDVTNKANMARSFLQWNLRTCSVQVKSDCYKSLVRPRPIIDYACIVWSPYTRHNINQVEMVQQQAARFVTNNFSRYESVTCVLHNLGWTSLEYRRKELHALTLYKIFYNLIEVNTADILIPTTRVTRGNSLKFNQPYTRVDCYLS